MKLTLNTTLAEILNNCTLDSIIEEGVWPALYKLQAFLDYDRHKDDVIYYLERNDEFDLAQQLKEDQKLLNEIVSSWEERMQDCYDSWDDFRSSQFDILEDVIDSFEIRGNNDEIDS